MSCLDADDPLSSVDIAPPPSDIPTLEELVDACCLHAITNSSANNSNNNTHTHAKQYLTPENFQNFVNKTHCEENLQFLIQIYKYEYIWNQLFKRRSSILKCKKQKHHHHHHHHHHRNSIHQRPQQTPKLIPVPNITTTTSATENLIDKINLTATEDISSFVNLTMSNSTVSKPDSWNDFDHSNSITDTMSSNGEDASCTCSTEEFKDEVDPEVKNDLLRQWHLIISLYIQDNAPHQINLPSHIYKDLLRESNNDQILYHSPEILIAAKNSVLQLLRSNIYEEFLDFYTPMENKNQQQKNNINNTPNNTPASISATTSYTTGNTSVDIPTPRPSSPAISSSSSAAAPFKLKKLHTVANILPLAKGHTVHSFDPRDTEEHETSTRGPCNVRVEDYALFEGLQDIKSHEGIVGARNGAHHHHHHLKKGWVKKLLKH